MMKKRAVSAPYFSMSSCGSTPLLRDLDIVPMPSYTTGVPAAVGAELMLKGLWKGKGVFNMEQFDPDPFMDVIGPRGLPWKVITPEDTLEG